MKALGSQAPDFELQDVVTGRQVSRRDVAGPKGMLAMFICRHCPYVAHVRSGLADLGRDYADADIAIVAISSNDADEYPADRPESLAEEAAEAGYTFPYLYDESQEIGKKYGATVTPEFFVLNKDRKIVYMGAMDDNMNAKKVTKNYLEDAVKAALAGDKIGTAETKARGCSVKYTKK